ncbi:DNA-directed RNA polymerase, partial [Trifolium pratense]
MLVDSGGLWFRVLAARYGVERGRLRDGGRRGSLWWREIVRIREGDGEQGGRWFGEHVRFGRLFELASNKSCTVAEMFALGWGADGEAWEWRRQLRAWEEELLGESPDISCFGFYGCCGESHMAPTGSDEGFYPCVAVIARQVVYESESGYSTGFIFYSSLVCFWM